MCLAKAFLHTAQPGVEDAGRLVMENVTQVVVDDGNLRLKSLFGEVESLQARIVSVDFAEGKLVLESAKA